MKYVFFLVLLLIVSISGHSQCVPEEEHFSSPDEQTDGLKVACKAKVGDMIEYCNGEACGYLKYPKAIYDVELHEKPDLESPIIGKLKRCETIKDFKLVSILRDFGEVEALTDLKGYGLKKGGTLKFVWTQEGAYYGCINSKPVVVGASSEKSLKYGCFYHLKDSNLEEWGRHKGSNGKVGYSKIDSSKSFYVPYGGDKSLICPEDK